MCYYFDDITKIKKFDFDYIIIDEISYENIVIYGISYKSLIGSKPLRIRFHKAYGFVRVYDGKIFSIIWL